MYEKAATFFKILTNAIKSPVKSSEFVVLSLLSFQSIRYLGFRVFEIGSTVQTSKLSKVIKYSAIVHYKMI